MCRCRTARGSVQFTAPTAEPVAIAVYDDSGVKIRDASVTAVKGSNSWTWDGTDNTGSSVADGSYQVVVSGGNTDGSTTALPFSVSGIATGVLNQNNTVQLQLGALSVGFDKVLSVGN